MSADNQESGIRPSVKALLGGAIDYAGLFPPSAVSMPEAVLNYATYRNSNYSWMLGRLVVTASRLDEFYETAREFISRDGKDPWRVAIIAGDDVTGTINQIKTFNAEHGPDVVCDSIEIRTDSPGDVENASASLPPEIAGYFEVPLDDRLPDLVATLSTCGQRAKIRTGGITPEAFPETDSVIRFVRTCLAANVPFKATAGLHHPIRCFKPLTYEADSVQGTMHGFLNLFLMTGFAREGFRPDLLTDLMEEEFEEVFEFDDQSVSWREGFSLSLRQIVLTRRTAIQSFGSCSFDEPVTDLQKLGIL